MREFTFTAWCRYGKGDSGESWIDVELTDQEAERLLHYGTKAEIFYNGFDRCEELKDLYQRIYKLAVDQMTQEVKDASCLGDLYKPEWRIDDTYQCGVNFPNAFEYCLTEEE